MRLYSKAKDYELYNGNMLDMLEVIKKESIDSIVCDPPYELNFMNKGWDNSGIAFNKETWKKCYEVLKPSGYLLAFGGSRTFHRIACAIEDAGFEIRDTIMWLYGSGFPKSMNVGLAIDKKNGVESKIVGKKQDNLLRTQQKFKEQDGRKTRTEFDNIGYIKQAQNEWAGWGTCLKPAYEPVIVARKPFKGSLIDNVIQYGVGGINIDECRVGEEIIKGGTIPKMSGGDLGICNYKTIGAERIERQDNIGRFPANVILTYDESDKEEVCGGMPDTKSVKNKRSDNRENKGNSMFIDGVRSENNSYDDEGSASRYFYCAKASKKDRDEGLVMENGKQNPYAGKASPNNKNIHPTVKPIELMQYLVRMVTPKGGTIMDCFMGSGSTGKATMFENRERNANYHFIGIELTEEYLPICEARIDYALNKYKYEEEKEEKERKEQGIMNIFDFIGGENK